MIEEAGQLGGGMVCAEVFVPVLGVESLPLEFSASLIVTSGMGGVQFK